MPMVFESYLSLGSCGSWISCAASSSSSPDSDPDSGLDEIKFTVNTGTGMGKHNGEAYSRWDKRWCEVGG